MELPAVRRLTLTWLRLLAAFLLAGMLPIAARADASSQVILPDSIRPVELTTAPPAGSHKPWIKRYALKQEEMDAPMHFEVALKMRNFPELQARIARGERISAAEMAAKYEPLAADYESVAAWLRGQGLSVARADSHHVGIFVRGKVSDVQRALGVSFARVTADEQDYTSAITPPAVPAALSPLLVGLNGLQPNIRAHRHLIRRQDLPNVSGGGANYFPAQIADAYDATPLYNAKFNGSGQAIAIVIDTFPSISDVTAFWKAAGIAQSSANLQFIQAVAGQLPTPSGEETLDVEWSSAMAPKARVRVYAATDLESSDLDTAYAQVYSDVRSDPGLGIHQMSMSYGEGETYTTYAQVQTDDQYFAELAAAGVTVFASSGDDGSTPDGNGGESGPVQVESPASDPNVTGVGGTTLILGATNNISSETVWNENGGASGGGYSIYFTRPTWQTGVGVGTNNNRQVPDVAASADPNYGAIVVFQGSQQVFGGTSWSSPTWAGLCALFNQARAGAGKSSIGLLGPSIYPLLGTPNYPATYLATFNDITSGNNSTRRSKGLYSATTGYDLCTGVGTPQAEQIASLVTGTAGLVGIEMPAAVQSVVPGQNASFTVTVSGTTATYQWQRMPIGSTTWATLTESGTYTGTTTATLTINNATPAMSGDQFQCLVTIGSTTTPTSPPSVLVVAVPLDITTLAGQAGVPGLNNGKSNAEFNYPSGLAVDGLGNIYVADYSNNNIREVAPDGTVSTPYGSLNGYSGATNAAGNSASFNSPNGVAIDQSGNLYIADTGNNLIREISGGTVSTLAGATAFNGPEGVAVDGSGNVYVADTGNNVIWEITPGGAASIIAGQNGSSGYEDGAATTKALFNSPSSVAVDASGNVFVADFGNSVIREISGGTVSTIAGQAGQAGYLDGLGKKALFNAPVGIAVDGVGNVYIADALVPALGSTAAGNNVLRLLSTTGVVSTIAGQVSMTGTDDGVGSAAQFYSLQAAAVSASGEVYLADTYNQTIRLGGPTAASRVIALSGTFDFGGVIEGETATSTLTITNAGSAQLDVTKITYPAGFSGSWSGSIASGGSQDVTVTFAPTAVKSYGGNIVVSSDATAGASQIAVSGTGLPVPVAPVVTTSLASSITGTSATLGATVNPGGVPVSVYFEYGPTTAYGFVTGTDSIQSGTTAVAGAAVTGTLSTKTLYHYRAVATNSVNTAYGLDKTFTTLAAPVFGATPIAEVGAANVQVNETLNANGVPAEYYFQYGTDSTYGSITGPQNIAGSTAVNTATLFQNLTPSTTYYYQMVTISNAGTFYGPQGTFTTLGFETSLMDVSAPSASQFDVLGNPVVNSSGAVAFDATLTPNFGGVSAAGGSGIWTQNATDSPVVSATLGSLAPGTAGVFRYLGTPVFNDNGAVAFIGALVEQAGVANGGNDFGIWSTSSGTLSLVMRQGGQAPGYAKGVTFVAFNSFALPDQGGVLIFATLSNSVLSIWQGNTTADLHQIAATATTVNGKTIASITFLPTLPYVNGQTRSFDEATGNLAYYALFTNHTYGIVQTGISGTAVPVVTGSAAPGTTGTFATLGNPALNTNGGIAFQATLAPAVAIPVASRSGIWADDNTGTLQLVAQTGTAAPGTTGTFSTLSDPVYNDNEAVAFRGTLRVAAGQATPATAIGIWASTSGTLSLVARQGSQAPGCPPGATFASFTSLALADQGGVIFTATLNPNAAAGVTAANLTGIWAVDNNGNLQLIARTGDIFDGWTITSLTCMPVIPYVSGQSRNFDLASGDLVYQAGFSNHLTGILEVVFP
jgi:kumamolisin